MAAEPPPRVLVPVRDSITLRNTVAYAIREVADALDSERSDAASRPQVHFVYLATWRQDDPGTAARRENALDLLDRVEVWAEYDLEDAELTDAVGVETALIAEDEYLFGASEYAQRLLGYAAERGLDRIIVDPEYAPEGRSTLLQPLEFELSQSGLRIEEAPVERPARHVVLVRRASAGRFLTVFGISFLFYLVLGDPTYWFDLLTGAASAALTAIVLSSVAFNQDPTLRESPMRILRLLIYLPALLYEIVKANVEVAVVILHPEMPIEPRMTRVRALVGGGLPLTTLANSITLTPGTLTVLARDRNLYVHSLLPTSREGLFDGGLERWTRYVFYGRDARDVPPPRERDDTAVLQGEEADGPLFPEDAQRADGGVAGGDGGANGGDSAGGTGAAEGGGDAVTGDGTGDGDGDATGLGTSRGADATGVGASRAADEPDSGDESP